MLAVPIHQGCLFAQASVMLPQAFSVYRELGHAAGRPEMREFAQGEQLVELVVGRWKQMGHPQPPRSRGRTHLQSPPPLLESNPPLLESNPGSHSSSQLTSTPCTAFLPPCSLPPTFWESPLNKLFRALSQALRLGEAEVEKQPLRKQPF